MNKIRYGIKNLGGHIDVGQLYDASTDTRIPGEFLWYRNQTKNITGPDIFQTKQSHGTSRNLLDRLSHLELDASLKVSFLGGLIEISGSANYLNHQREYKNSYRVTRQYHGEGKDVSIDTEMSVVNHNNCKSPGATHVVTAVKYGFNAFMTFEVEKFEDEKDHNIGKVQINESKLQRKIDETRDLTFVLNLLKLRKVVIEGMAYQLDSS